MNIRAKILLFLVFSYSIPLFSQRNEFQGKLKEIKSLIEADNIDFLKLKMTVDQLVFPNQDHNVHAQIEQMVSKISTLIRDGSSSSRIAAIRKYLYERGAWNDHQEYVYDLDDPMGTKLSGGILANYLSSRKGNCVSMPILFFIIAKKLDLDVSLSAAPEHVLMKFTDSETGRTFNVETTSGGHFARTAWLQSLRSITDAALKNGIYLSKLTDKESAAIMLMTLSQYYKGTKEYENVIRISDLALSFYPKFVHAMLSKGSAYYKILERDYLTRYRSVKKIPESLRGKFFYYNEENRKLFQQAELLGWRPTPQVSEKQYSKMIKKEKQRRRGR